ncbi:MAG TPA: tRNA uridine-5-carboxymethylaminomethyl(34) synthesis GTPase MnmE, partial [Methylocella sp.]|nr:tRNA uridine-5-carboxymethylaminomethyl(34) synthesis GTPase MnmE [Methylocella sp.]
MAAITRFENDTIFAIASGAGRSAIAVLRLSGPGACGIVQKIAGKLPEPRAASLVTFRDPASGEAIDRGLAIFFPAPKSFTGEDYAEFHLHGGRAVVAGMVKAVGALSC